MSQSARANLAHNGLVAGRRTGRTRVSRRGCGLALVPGVVSILLAGVVFAPPARASDTPATPPTTPGAAEAPVPPPVRPPEIPPLLRQPLPAPRKGRPAITIDGNRRWGPGGPPKGPDTPVPFWHEVYRCVTMPEHMDFDLDPGTYDVYMAFDLLNRDGGWVHRSIGYLTDIRVEAARRTRLDGMINLARGADRQVELQSAAIEPEATASPAAPGP